MPTLDPVPETRLPRVPTSLECEWLDERLKKTGRNGFLGAETMPTNLVKKSSIVKAARSKELLMAVANDTITTPRDFKHIRRLRAVLSADHQRRKTRSSINKSGANEDVQIAAQERAAKVAESKQQEEERKQREARPLVGVGSMVRVRDVAQPTYGWGEPSHSATLDAFCS